MDWTIAPVGTGTPPRGRENVVSFPYEAALAAEGDDVERINQFDIYDLSRQLKSFARHGGDTPATEPLFELMDLRAAVERLVQGKPIPLGVSQQAAQAIYDWLSEMTTRHYYTEGEDGKRSFTFPTDETAPIPGWEFSHYRTLLSTFDTVFAAEMREVATYFVPRRGIFFTPALVDTADDSFPAEVRAFIPEKAKVDWRSAGRCLAFSLLSASGFHVARAVEGTLETYYQIHSGKPGATLHNWNDYLVELDKIVQAGSTPPPAQKTLAELKQMKDDYRNPIMHPRVVLTETDARMLFDNGESLIIAMADEIKIALTGAKPTLLIKAPGTP